MVFMGVAMLASLYGFMKYSKYNPPLDPAYYKVDWRKEAADPQQKLNGQMQFEIRCMSCHGPQGQGGLVAPSLADAQWIHGGSYDEVFGVICEGIGGTQMTGWRTKLQKTDIVAITVYVESLSTK